MTLGQEENRADLLEKDAVTKWGDLLMQIMEDLARLEATLVVIQLEMAGLDDRWPAQPTEVWEARNGGEKRYLRLSFPGGVLPGGQRTVYIGCDPDKIEDARAMAKRCQRWERLEREERRLRGSLEVQRYALGRVAGEVKRYQVPEELGLGKIVSPAVLKTKSEWLRTRPDVEYNVEGDDG